MAIGVRIIPNAIIVNNNPTLSAVVRLEFEKRNVDILPNSPLISFETYPNLLDEV